MLGVAGIIMVATALMLQIAGFPGYMRLLPNREHICHAPFPLSLVVKNDRAGIIRNPRADESKKKGGACTALVVGPNRIGKADIEVRLFGVIPVRQLVIDVSEPVKVIPCGHAIGVLLASKGVVILGDIAIRGTDGREYRPARDGGVTAGDVLIAIDGEEVAGVDDVERLVAGRPGRKQVTLTIRRHGQILTRKVRPIVASPREGSRPRAMLGVYIQDPAAGIGTLTFYEADTGRFAALGHMVSQPTPEVRLEAGEGQIVEANVVGVDRGAPGEPGEKIGVFRAGRRVFGTVYKNCRYGIYGQLDLKPVGTSANAAVPIALASEVHTGPAEIFTVLKGTRVRRFQVRIERVSRQLRPGDKGLVLVVTDPELLEATNGVIQGMSGSPIIQDGKLVGAVTHVFVNDPHRGYGVLAEWMWYEAVNTRLPGGKAPEDVSGAFLFGGLRMKRFMMKEFTVHMAKPVRKLYWGVSAVGAGKVRVLIADDNTDFCVTLKEYFSAHPSLEVAGIVHSGLDVFRALKESPVDVLLLDVIMPQFDGLAVLEELKRSGAKGSLRVIVLSAFGQETMTQKAVHLGADYFIVKPFDLETLVRRILEVASGNQTAVRRPVATVTEAERQVSRVFSELGIPAHFRGYLYLREAVLMAISDPGAVNGITKKLYPAIAGKFNTTRHRVERSMRFAIERAWSTGKIEALNEYFGFSVDGKKGKPTNACFIAKIADQVRLGLKAG